SYETVVKKIDDWGTVKETETNGMNFHRASAPVSATNDYKAGAGIVTGIYSTSAFNSEWGVLENQDTNGLNYLTNQFNQNNLQADGSILGPGYISGSYATITKGIDGWGTVTETETKGMNFHRNTASAIGYEAVSGIVTGIYLTSAFNSDWGVLEEQSTRGVNYVTNASYQNHLQNAGGSITGSGFISSSYETLTTGIDEWGTILGTDTTGLNFFRDSATAKTGDKYGVETGIVTGEYSTIAVNNQWGILQNQTTGGVNYLTNANNENLLQWDGTIQGLKRVTGIYSTYVNELVDGVTLGSVNSWGTVQEQVTVGESYAKANASLVSAIYTTVSTNNDYGTLGSQVTAGISFNGVGRTGSYVTTIASGDIDEWGAISADQTVGVNLKQGHTTGVYTTDKTYDIWGLVDSQITTGMSHLNDQPDKIRGSYTTTASNIDEWGMIRQTTTAGNSYTKGDINLLSGEYVTQTINDTFGVMQSQTTTGVSYRDYKGTRVTTGSYNTTAVDIDADFGILLESHTEGEGYRRDGSLSSVYSTVNKYEDTWGIANYSRTVGESYDRVMWEALGQKEVSGRYTTIVTDYNEWGDQLQSETAGESLRNGDITGFYTTITTFQDGVTASGITDGISCRYGNANDKTGDYFTVNFYDEWGESQWSRTTGTSGKMILGEYVKNNEYTTDSYMDEWGQTVTGDTVGRKFKYGMWTEIYTTHTDYDDGVTSYSFTEGTNRFGDILSYETDTYYDTYGGIYSTHTVNDHAARGIYESETYFTDNPYSDHPNDKIIDHMISDNTEEDIFDDGPLRVTTNYEYVAFEEEDILGVKHTVAALYSTTADDSRNTLTVYKQSGLFPNDAEERNIDYMEAKNSDEDIVMGGPDRVITSYAWTTESVKGDDNVYRPAEVMDSTQADDSRNTFTKFQADSITGFYQDRNIDYTLSDNRFEDIVRGGPDRVTTDYYWKPLYDNSRYTYNEISGQFEPGKWVSALDYTLADDSAHTETVYKDDPVKDDAKKRVMDYVETDSSARDIASGHSAVKRTSYNWKEVSETRTVQGQQVTMTAAVLDWTETFDPQNSSVIYDITVYKDDPYSDKLTDTVINYRINEKGDYVIYTHEEKSRGPLTKGVVSKTEYRKGAIDGTLRSETFYKDDGVYQEGVFTTTPMDARVVDYVISYKRDGTTADMKQEYEYRASGAPSYDYDAAGAAGTEDYDHDNDEGNVGTKMDAWHAYDLDYVTAYDCDTDLKRSETIYMGDKTDEIVFQTVNFKQDGTTIDNIITYSYTTPDGYTRTSAQQDRVYNVNNSDARRLIAYMDYFGLAGKEKMEQRIAYERDGQTVAGITNYDYDAGRMIESRLKITLGGGLQVLMSKTLYKGDEDEEMIDEVENYAPIAGGELLGVEKYVYDDDGTDPTFALLWTETYDNKGILEGARVYGSFSGSTGTGEPDQTPQQGEEVIRMILSYYPDRTVRTTTKYTYDEYAINYTETFDVTNDLLAHTEYDSDIPGDERIEYTKNYDMETYTEYIYENEGTYPCRMDAPVTRNDVYELDLDTDGKGNLMQKVYFAVAETYYLRGMENRDYMDQYENDGTTKASKTEYYYGAYKEDETYDIVGADEAGKYDPLRRTDYYYYYSGGTPSPIVQETFYVGYKGNEIRDYALTYELDGTTVRETLDYVYDEFGALDKTVSYVGTSTIVASETDYVGMKGQEKISTSTSYEIGETGGKFPAGLTLDVNGDGRINDVDVHLLKESLKMELDVNNDGKHDYRDVEAISKIINALAFVNGNKDDIDDIYNADLNSDGEITEDEVAEMRTYLSSLADVDLDGEFTGADADVIQQVIDFLGDFDSDGDGESDQDEYLNGSDPFNPNSNSGNALLGGTSFNSASSNATGVFDSGQYQSGSYGTAAGPVLEGGAVLSTASGASFLFMNPEDMDIVGRGPGSGGTGVIGGIVPTEIVQHVLDFVKAQGPYTTADYTTITSTVQTYLETVQAEYSTGTGSEFDQAGGILAVTNPALLTTGGISAVCAWLMGQVAKIVACGAKALQAYLKAKGETETAEEVAATTIIEDILIGMITETATGDLPTSVYALARLSEAKGLTLMGVETTPEDLLSITPPYIAVLDVDGANHYVMVRNVTASAVIYRSDDTDIALSKEEFAGKFAGVALIPQATLENLSRGEKTVIDFVSGSTVSMTRDADGTLLDVTVSAAAGDTEEGLLGDILADSMLVRSQQEEYLVELYRLKENAVLAQVINILDNRIKVTQEDKDEITNFIDSLNVFLARAESDFTTAADATALARDLTAEALDLKIEIDSLRIQAVTGAMTIRSLSAAIGECLAKDRALEELFNEIKRLAYRVDPAETQVLDAIQDQADITYTLVDDAGNSISRLAGLINGIADSDGDMFGDDEEAAAGTNPMDYNDTPESTVDTDGDGYSDSFEILSASDPNDDAITPNNAYLHEEGTDNRTDSDHDGAPDWIEMIIGTGIYTTDTDGDNFTDYEEMRLGTDPKDALDKPASEDMKDLVHTPTWRMGMLSLDAIERADINGDDRIDITDIVTLSNMMTNFADLTEDRVLDAEDIARMTDIIRFASMKVSVRDVERADLAGYIDQNSNGEYDAGEPFTAPDGKIDECDLAAITEGVEYYKDVNGDGKVDQEDVALVGELKTLGLTVQDIENADIDGNGFVNDADLDIVQKALDFSSQLFDDPWQHMEHMDHVIEYLELSGLLFEGTMPRMDVNGDGEIDIADMHKIIEIQNIIRDVNEDELVSWADGDRILQMIGEDKIEQLITEEQIKRSNVDGAGGVTINDYELIKNMFDRIQKGDVNGDGTIDDDDTDAMGRIIQYNQALQDWGITPENVAVADLNDDGKVDAADVALYENAFNVLYATVTVKREGVSQAYPVADFNYDGKVNAYDREYLDFMIQKMKDQSDEIPNAKWIEIIGGIKTSDFNGDHMLDDLDRDRITATIDRLQDVDGNNIIGDDAARFDPGSGLIVSGGNGQADDLDKIRLIINQGKYYFTNGEIDMADIAGGDDSLVPYGGDDDVVDSQDVLAFQDAIDNYLWRDLNGDKILDETDIGLVNAISNYQRVRKTFGVTDLTVFDINGENIRGAIIGDGLVNQADVDAMQRHMDNLVDVNGDNIIDSNDKDLFLAIVNAAINGFLETSLLGITQQQCTAADANGDGRISLADRQLVVDSDVDIDGDGDGPSVDSDDLPLFDIIHGYINPYKMDMCDINGDTSVTAADYNTFSADLATYQGSTDPADLAKYDIDGDDNIDADDLAELQHVLNDYIAYSITQDKYDLCDIVENDPEDIVVLDADDREAFKRSYGYDAWGNCTGVNLIKLDINKDGNVNNEDLQYMIAKVTAGLDVQIFSDKIVQNANANGDKDAAGMHIIDSEDQDLLQWAINVTGNLYAVHGRNAISDIIKFISYREAKQILELYDIEDENGRINTQSEIQVFMDNNPGLSESEALVKINWANRNGVTDQQKSRADITGNGIVDDADLNEMLAGLNDISKYNRVNDPADNGGLPVVDEKDLEYIVELINYIQEGVFGGNIYDKDGNLIGVGDLLSVIFTGNLDASGTGAGIDEADLLLFDDSLSYMKDIFWTPSEVGQGIINQADLDKLEVMASLSSLGVEPIWLTQLRGDINGNGKVDQQDIVLVNDIMVNQAQYDIDGNELLSQTDVDIVEEVMNKKLTAVEINRADINNDGKVDRVDWEVFHEAFVFATGRDYDGKRLPELTGIDINGDGDFSELDIVEWIRGQRLLELEEYLDDYGIVIDSYLFDVVDQHGHLLPDGVIDSKDRRMLAETLRRLKVDITGDGQMTQADMDKALDIISIVSGYGVSIDALANADIDGDDQITQDDIDLINSALNTVIDMNGDGRKDIADVQKLREVVDYVTLKRIYGKDTLLTADTDGDGLVSEEEKKELLAVINYYVDVTGDGLVTQADIERLTDVLTYLRLDVTPEEFGMADLNDSGGIDEEDIAAMEYAVDMFGKCDINGDGIVNIEDRDIIDDIAHFMDRMDLGTIDYTMDELWQADINDDGIVDNTDVEIIDYYLTAKFDLGGTEGIWDLEDVNIMTKIVEYFNKRVDNLVRQYADISGDGLVTNYDITALSGYLEDIAKGDFKGNGPVMQLSYMSIDEGLKILELDEENSTVSEAVERSYTTESAGVYTTMVRTTTVTEEGLEARVVIDENTKKVLEAHYITDDGDDANDRHAVLVGGFTTEGLGGIYSGGYTSSFETGSGYIIVPFEGLNVMFIQRAGDGIINEFDLEKMENILNFLNYDYTYRVETAVDTTPGTGNAKYVYDGSYTSLVVYYDDSSRDEIKLDINGNVIEVTVVDIYGDGTTLALNSSNSSITEEGVEIPDIAGQKVIIAINESGDITHVVRVKKIDISFEDVLPGVKTDAEGNIMIDANGLPIPDDTKTRTEKIANSVVYRADVNRDGVITAADKEAIQAILNEALDLNGDGDICDLDFENIAAVVESIKMNLTEDDVRKADIDLDGDIDADDIQVF
ncbi:MAG: dockerin type I domain-containing protein, partial [Candidatus Omnitrophota bacterium]